MITCRRRPDPCWRCGSCRAESERFWGSRGWGFARSRPRSRCHSSWSGWSSAWRRWSIAVETNSSQLVDRSDSNVSQLRGILSTTETAYVTELAAQRYLRRFCSYRTKKISLKNIMQFLCSLFYEHMLTSSCWVPIWMWCWHSKKLQRQTGLIGVLGCWFSPSLSGPEWN